jgi:hypothetical protein
VTGLLPCCQQAVLDGLDLTSHALAEHPYEVPGQEPLFDLPVPEHTQGGPTP